MPWHDLASFPIVGGLVIFILWRERHSALHSAACLICFFSGFTGFSIVPAGFGVQVSFAAATLFLAMHPKTLSQSLPSRTLLFWLLTVALSVVMSYAVPGSVDGMAPWWKSLTQLIAHVVFFLTCVVIYAAALTAAAIQRMVKYLIAGGIFCAVFALLQVPLVAGGSYDLADLFWNNPSYGGVVAKSSGLISNHIAKSRLGVLRVWGPAMEPAYLGAHLGLVATTWIAVLMAGGRGGKNRWSIGGLVVVLVALVLTQARGALLAFCVCAGLQFVVGVDMRRRRNKALALLLVPAILAGSWLGLARMAGQTPEDMMQERFGFLAGSNELHEDYSAGARFAAVRIAFDMLKDFPLLGVGIGNYGFHVYEYIKSEYRYSEFKAGEWHVPFGWPAWAMSETGLAGTLFFLAVLLQVGRSGVRLWRDLRWRWLAGLSWGFLSLVIGGIAGSHVITPYWWVCIGLILGAERCRQAAAHSEQAVLARTRDAMGVRP